MNWQKDFFQGVALEAWRRVVTPEWTKSDVDFLERYLHLRAGHSVLDVPCGNGRHAIELARRGCRVTGMDQSEESIAEAGAAAPGVQWVLGDMCELPWAEEFDGAFCFGNSFGYLDRGGVRRFLAAVARTLKPGARFAIETGMAAESILPTRQSTRWFRLGDIFMLSENQYHPAEGRLDIQYTFIHGGKVEKRPTSSYTFTAAEICHLHREAGLHPEELLGSAGGEPYQLGSPGLLMVSVKR